MRMDASLAAALLACMFLVSAAAASHTSCSGTSACAQDDDDDDDDDAVLLVEVDASAVSATTDEAFICATLDWWPPDKCDYGTCAWGQASLLNLDLSNPLLENSLKALYPFRVRLGGTLQDHIVYDVGLNPATQPCLPIVKDEAYMFGFREGCLSMDRWVALNTLFAKTGSLVAFGLNALFNRPRRDDGWGAWDSSNARDFVEFTINQGIQIDAWELGNELTANGVGTTISPEQYAQDVKELRFVIDSLYPMTRRPLLVAPDGFFNPEWYTAFLNASGPGVVDVVTRHIYNLGPGVSPDLVSKILNSSYLDNEVGRFRAVQEILRTTAPWASAWVGEAGGAYNSGHHSVTDAFVFSFWYLDQLGMAASYDNKVYCRQSLTGGNYGMLNTTTLQPNPDMYSALLWKRLMGTRVLATSSVEGYPQLRTYAHCHQGSTTGGLTILLINLSNSTVSVAVNLLDGAKKSSKYQLVPKKKRKKALKRRPTSRSEYHLSAPYQDLHSQTVLLNGSPLEVTLSGDFPSMDPMVEENSSPVSIAPLSIVFVALPDAQVPICVM